MLNVLESSNRLLAAFCTRTVDHWW
jgi:hypothetical protein